MTSGHVMRLVQEALGTPEMERTACMEALAQVFSWFKDYEEALDQVSVILREELIATQGTYQDRKAVNEAHGLAVRALLHREIEAI